MGRVPGLKGRKMRPVMVCVTPMQRGRFYEGKPQEDGTPRMQLNGRFSRTVAMG